MVFTAYFAQSQIIIQSTDFPLAAGTSSIFHVFDANAIQAYGEIQGGENMVWDLSSIAYSNDTVRADYYMVHPTAPYYPEASYCYNYIYSVFGQEIPSKEYEIKDDVGIRTIGFTIDTLYIPISGGSIAVLNQKVDYNPAYVKLTFPLQYNATDYQLNESKRTIKALLSYSLIGNNLPVDYMITYKRETIDRGWGKLKLPGYSDPIDVLCKQITETMIDSIFINGSPASNLLLSQVGLKQGKAYQNVETKFYTTGVPSYIAMLGKSIDGTTMYIYSTFKINESTNDVDGQIPQTMKAQVYPNPSTDNYFNVSFTKSSDKAWRIDVYDALGMKVNTSSVNNQAGKVDIRLSLESATNAGMYIYKIYNENEILVESGKTILAK